jgi:putative transposase
VEKFTDTDELHSSQHYNKTDEEEHTRRQEVLKAILHYFYQETTRAGAHTRYTIKYHFVWIPKYRKPILVGPIAVRLRQILDEIASDYGLTIIAQEVMPDHVHILVEAHPTHAPSYIAQVFKSISARKLRQEFSEAIKKHIWKEGSFWASGYYVVSVGDGITTEMVKEYIENQKDKPQNNGTIKSKGNNSSLAPACAQLRLF